MQERIGPESEEPPEISFEEMADKIRGYLEISQSARIAFQKPGIPLDDQEIRPENYSSLVEGVMQPTIDVCRRIEAAFGVITMLIDEGEDPTLIQSWFDQTNPELDGLTPIEAIGINAGAVRMAARSLIENDYYRLSD